MKNYNWNTFINIVRFTYQKLKFIKISNRLKYHHFILSLKGLEWFCSDRETFAKTNSFYGLIISIKSMRKVNALNFSFGALNWTEQVKALCASFYGKLSFQSFFSMRNASLLKTNFSWYFNLWMEFHQNFNAKKFEK